MIARALPLPAALAALLVACAGAPPPAPAAPPPALAAPAPPPPAPVAAPAAPAPVVAPAPPPPRWALVYHRECAAGITAPVVSPDGQVVSSCGARFDVARGHFLGNGPKGLLALVPGDRAVVDEYEDGGLTLVPPGDGEPVRDAGGRPESVAVSPDGTRVVSLETKDGERSLVVREIPSLRRVRATSLGKGPTDGPVFFLPDGREGAFTAYPCSETACEGDKAGSCKQMKCDDPGLFVIDQGAPTPLLRDLARAAVGARGDVAAVVRKDGSAALLALPEGRTVAELPKQATDKDIDAIAVSAAGDRVAVAIEDRLAVYARAGEGFVEVLADKRHFTRSLRFTADGRGLFAGDDLGFYREGAAPREEKPVAYEPTLPHGFVRLLRSGNEWQMPGDEGKNYSHLAADGSVAMFRNEKIGVEVMIDMFDPDEIDADGDAETWALRVAARHFPDTPLDTKKNRKKAGFAAWGGAGEGRAMELHWTDSGCEDMDNYDRVSERDGAVYHVHVNISGILPKKRVAPWLAAFIDEPLGQSPARAADKPASAHPKHPAKKHKHGRKKG